MAAEIVSALLGAGVGAFLGAALQEYLRYRGSVHCVVSEFKWNRDRKDLPPYYEAPPAYSFYLKVFNERLVGAGVRDIVVEFFVGNDKKDEDRPKSSADPYYRADQLNFDSGKWTIERLMAHEYISNDPERTRAIEQCDRARLVAILPSGKEFEVDIPMDGTEAFKNIA